MSAVKSQIHDGFATIRTRGLHRSRSKAEQYENARPVAIRCDSGPLYENNNDIYYKNVTASTTPPPSAVNQLNSVISNTRNEINSIYSSTSNSSSSPSPNCQSFKPFENHYDTDYKTVVKSTQEILEKYDCGFYSTFNSQPTSPIYCNVSSLKPKTPDGYNLYSRPESPGYKKPTVKTPSPNIFDYSRVPNVDSYDYLNSIECRDDEKIVTKKPPAHYRKSFSHPGKHRFSKYSSSTDYLESDSSTEMSEISSCPPPLLAKTNGFERRYATLAHPRENQKLHQTKFTTSSTADISDSSKYILDCKVGCQTTLRSKPRIPWYELAIKQDIRRQSCPPFEEAHVVAAFEQSLTNMTQRLQMLTVTSEKKDGELTDMRQTIELLRKQSIQCGLTSAHMQSMGVPQNTQENAAKPPTNNLNNNSVHPPPPGNGLMQRHHSTDSMCSLNSLSSGCSAQDKKKKKGWLRSSFTKAFSRNAKISKTNRHVSSMSSTAEIPSSAGSDCSSTLPPPSPTKSPHKTLSVVENAKPLDSIDAPENAVVDELKKQLREKDLVLTDIRLEALSSASQLESLKDTVMKMRAEMMNLKHNNERLQKMVVSRSLAGSEVSLGGPVSPNGSIGEPRRFSLVDGMSRPPLELPKSLEETEEENIPPAPAPDSLSSLSPTTHIDLTPPPKMDGVSNELSSTTAEDVADSEDGKKIAISVYLGQADSFTRYADEMNECDNYYSSQNQMDNQILENGYDSNHQSSFPSSSPNEFVISYVYISGKTTWQNLDYIVSKTFKDYLSKIDPGTHLGLNTDSITSYHLGEAKRGPEMGFPELLPCGYIIGTVETLYICLHGVGSLAFDSLIPKSIVHRYISLLNEHRRLILCGPSGTGKSYLARKLAEFLVARSGRGNISEAIATFNVDHKSSKELRQYLGHIAEQASLSNGASDLPSVIILDNLHHASALGDVFSCLLSAGPATKLPCIIGTMSQATCNTTNLQLHHNFRWVLTANHMEPVKGFLGRFLRRRLYLLELSKVAQPQLAAVLAWLPTVWQHINRFLETHSSSDVTIGPRLFLSCPLDLTDSQVWFTDVWNYHLAPYLVEAVREGVQLYGRRGGAWVDPCTYIRDSYPWPQGPAAVATLRQVIAEEVGLEADPPENNESEDPLLNMLLRLQEAANYTENQGHESDCASLDSNITQDSSAEQ